MHSPSSVSVCPEDLSGPLSPSQQICVVLLALGRRTSCLHVYQGNPRSPANRCMLFYAQRHAYGCTGLTTWQGTETCEESVSAEGMGKRAPLSCDKLIVICDIYRRPLYICVPLFCSSVKASPRVAKVLRQIEACLKICTNCSKFMREVEVGEEKNGEEKHCKRFRFLLKKN